MAETIAANLTAVDRLGGDLASVRSAMIGLGSFFDGYESALGSGQVLEALRRFYRESSDARENLDNLLDRSVGMMTSLSTGLRQVDSDLRANLTDPPPSQPASSGPGY